MGAVTHHPTEANRSHWWLTAWGSWRRLHAVPADELTQQQHRDSIDRGDPIVRFTACGSRIALAVPGMGSRLSLRRCVPCCRRLGIRGGRGTPANERNTLSVDIDVRVPDFKAATANPFEPNVRTCNDCGQPYVAGWADISQCFSSLTIDGQTTQAFSVATNETHSPCPAKPA
ncbi:hypothetical protein [Streptodolium elevatio]|uniref:Uncharacterized protein n=1 Tax=Streptodolium elevatio TaxID=3157996 RepID=A0ABV3DJZ3_9ACTN